jgi:tRNA(Ile)-lysidine synthase
MQQQAVRVPDEKRLHEILRQAQSRKDAQPQISWPGAVLRMARGRLQLQISVARQEQPDPITWSWQRQPRLHLPTGGTLQLRPDRHGDVDLARLPQNIEVYWTDRPGRALKKRLQQLGVNAWERPHLPLLRPSKSRAGSAPLALADLWLASRWRADSQSKHRGRILWQVSS